MLSFVSFEMHLNIPHGNTSCSPKYHDFHFSDIINPPKNSVLVACINLGISASAQMRDHHIYELVVKLH